MNRAARRKLAKKEREEQKPKTFTYTSDQLNQVIEETLDREMKERLELAREQGVRDAFILMMTLPIRVLVKDFWQDSYIENLPKFGESVIDMYEQWMNDEININDLRDELWEEYGVKLEKVDQ